MDPRDKPWDDSGTIGERLREFATMIENLGNPNDIVREKHTSELEKALQANPSDSLVLCIGLIFSAQL